MTHVVMSGVLLEQSALNLEELAQACAVDTVWVVQHVTTGILLEAAPDDQAAWRFSSADLVRARRLLQIERDFDANDDVAALVVDLTDEIRRLRSKLDTAGLH